MLLVLCVAGCTNSVAPPPNQESLSISRVSPIRVIITLEHLPPPVAYDQQLFPLLADICACPPKFIDQYRTNAIIYEVTLPPDMSFTGFRNWLLDKGGKFGVRAVEQDNLMPHQ
jgi:hypothetical protein